MRIAQDGSLHPRSGFRGVVVLPSDDDAIEEHQPSAVAYSDDLPTVGPEPDDISGRQEPRLSVGGVTRSFIFGKLDHEIVKDWWRNLVDPHASNECLEVDARIRRWNNLFDEPTSLSELLADRERKSPAVPRQGLRPAASRCLVRRRAGQHLLLVVVFAR